MNDNTLVPSRDDFNASRLNFAMITLVLLFTIFFFVARGGGINVRVFSVIFGLLHAYITIRTMYKFRSNRDYRKVSKILAILLAFVFVAIFCFSFYLQNSVLAMILMISLYLLCNFVAAKFHESAMIIRI
jgi:hypothetical protein